jgi:hypothetical protein
VARGCGTPRAKTRTHHKAFRAYVLSLGAPDPGENEIDDVVGDDLNAAHREGTGAATTG